MFDVYVPDKKGQGKYYLMLTMNKSSVLCSAIIYECSQFDNIDSHGYKVYIRELNFSRAIPSNLNCDE